MTIYTMKVSLRLLAVILCGKSSSATRSIIIRGIGFCLLSLILTPLHVAAGENPAQQSGRSSSGHEITAKFSPGQNPAAAPHPRRANFDREQKSPDVQHVADWVVDSGDNQGLPFAIVDKIDAKVFVFYPDGRLRGAAPALLGMAKGDQSIPGIGNMKLSDVKPDQRTTPAGRFVASLGINYNGKDILWVDYEGAVSMHRVIDTRPADRRPERLASPTPLDNRISFGCINLPIDFFDNVISKAFTGTSGIVYILPEIRSKKEIFTAYYDVE